MRLLQGQFCVRNNKKSLFLDFLTTQTAAKKQTHFKIVSLFLFNTQIHTQTTENKYEKTDEKQEKTRKVITFSFPFLLQSRVYSTNILYKYLHLVSLRQTESETHRETQRITQRDTDKQNQRPEHLHARFL